MTSWCLWCMSKLTPRLAVFFFVVLDRWRCKRLREWCTVASGWSRHYLTTGRYGATKALCREVIQCHIYAAVQKGMMWSDKIKSLRDITTTRLVHCRFETMVSSYLWSLRMVGARGGNVQIFHHSGGSIIPAGPAPLTLIIQGKGKWYGAIQLKPLALLPNSGCDLQLSRILIIGVPHNIKRSCVQSFARRSLFSLIFLAQHWILAFCVTLEKRFISEIEAQLKKSSYW